MQIYWMNIKLCNRSVFVFIYLLFFCFILRLINRFQCVSQFDWVFERSSFRAILSSCLVLIGLILRCDLERCLC